MRRKEKRFPRLATDGLKAFDCFDESTYYLGKDAIFSVASESNTPLIQHILDCVFGEGKFTVAENDAQKAARAKISGKGVAYDVLAVDKDGRYFDLEIQIPEEDDLPKRAREYQAQIDARQLIRGQLSKELKDTYIIFITAYDPFDYGLSLYEEYFGVEGTDLRLEHGFHFLYVNAAYPEEGTALGDLCSDLFLQNSSQIHSKTVRNALEYCREKERKGEVIMRMRQTELETSKKTSEEIACNFLKLGKLTDEEIIEGCHVSPERLEELKAQIDSEGQS